MHNMGPRKSKVQGKYQLTFVTIDYSLINRKARHETKRIR
jgi:hypothetical protein